MHEQMHEMMNGVHGEGASQKMHEAMGPQSEKMMDQCTSMTGDGQNMGGMQNMQGMMGGGEGQTYGELQRHSTSVG